MKYIPASVYTWAKSVNEAPLGLSGSNYTYNSGSRTLVVKKDGVVTLQSGVYSFQDISLSKNAKLQIAPGASVVLYITGYVYADTGAAFNQGGNPQDLSIFMNGSYFELEDAAELYGTFYGPKTIFRAQPDANIYGAVVAREMELEDHSCIHYDRNLRYYTDGTFTQYKIIAWKLM